MDEPTVVAALAALAQAMRLRVFRALVGTGPVGMTPGALALALDMPASTLSFHLKELTRAGLISQQRAGRHLIYRPALDTMATLLAYLSAHCCGGAGCAPLAVRVPQARTTRKAPRTAPVSVSRGSRRIAR
jgi:ArsR family transcriptional regulator